MKKVFIYIFMTILFSIILNSCTIMDYSDVWDFEITTDMENKIKTLDDIEEWVAKNIKYSDDEERYGKWEEVYQTCQETLDRSTGDCDDIAILILGIAWKMFGVKGWMCVNSTFTTGHAWATIKGKDYYNKKGYISTYTLRFDDINSWMLR